MIDPFGVERFDLVSKATGQQMLKMRKLAFSRKKSVATRAKGLYDRELVRRGSAKKAEGLSEDSIQAIRSGEKMSRAQERLNAGYAVSAPKAKNIAASRISSGFKTNIANWKSRPGKKGKSHPALSSEISRLRNNK